MYFLSCTERILFNKKKMGSRWGIFSPQTVYILAWLPSICYILRNILIQ